MNAWKGGDVLVGKEIAMKHAIFIGGPMCGFVDDQPVNPKNTQLLVVRGMMTDHIYRVVKQKHKRKNKMRLRYVYWGTDDMEGEEYDE